MLEPQQTSPPTITTQIPPTITTQILQVHTTISLRSSMNHGETNISVNTYIQTYIHFFFTPRVRGVEVGVRVLIVPAIVIVNNNEPGREV